jgi:ATP-binding cassette subfamily F protein 3
MSQWTEESLTTTLSEVLLKKDIDGLDEDLVAYISGLLATQLGENDQSCGELLEETLFPFLESLGISDDDKDVFMKDAEAAISKKEAGTSTSVTAAPRKLRQGIVNMSSTLTDQSEEETNQLLWGSGEKVKANANKPIDAYQNKVSSKDSRKQRQELEKARSDLAFQNQLEQTSTKAGVSAMLIPTVKSKERDVLLPNITLALDNGTVLLESGDLKFAYQRRYGLVGENGVGKTTLLNRMANWQDLEGFPRHLRVVHVRQELNTGSEETSSLEAVLEADIEVQTLLKEEKEILTRLEKEVDTNADQTSNETIEEKRKRIAEAESTDEGFGNDIKRLKELYERLQLLSADTAKSRAAMILSGLQFTPEMQMAPIKSLSGGWRMRVALAAALLVRQFVVCLLRIIERN